MTLPVGAASDAYQRILAQIAPNAARLKESYNGHLARALLVAVNLHLLGLGTYWVATYVSALDQEVVVPPKGPIDIGPVRIRPADPPPLVPSNGRTQPPSNPDATAGIPTPVDDADADPDATVASYDEPLSTPGDGPIGTPSQGGNGTGAAGTPRDPYRPEVNPDPPSDPPERVERTEPEPETEFTFVETMPVLIGGIEGLQAGIAYPQFDREAGVEGTVVVTFVVNPDGSTSRVEAVRSPSPGLAAEAIAAVRRARFTPGIQNGRAVSVRQSLPVTFRIR